MTSTILLVRSGETAWHSQKKLVGRRDLGLTERGVRQSQALASMISPLAPSDLLASPLTRARETAEILAAPCGLSVGRDPRLTDVDVGPYEGKELPTLATEEFERFRRGEADRFPDGELLESVAARMTSAVDQVVGDNPGKSVLVLVSHSLPIRILIAHCLGLPLGACVRLRLDHGAVCVMHASLSRATCRLVATNWGASLSADLEDEWV